MSNKFDTKIPKIVPYTGNHLVSSILIYRIYMYIRSVFELGAVMYEVHIQPVFRSCLERGSPHLWTFNSALIQRNRYCDIEWLTHTISSKHLRKIFIEKKNTATKFINTKCEIKWTKSYSVYFQNDWTF